MFLESCPFHRVKNVQFRVFFSTSLYGPLFLKFYSVLNTLICRINWLIGLFTFYAALDHFQPEVSSNRFVSLVKLNDNFRSSLPLTLYTRVLLYTECSLHYDFRFGIMIFQGQIHHLRFLVLHVQGNILIL